MLMTLTSSRDPGGLKLVTAAEALIGSELLVPIRIVTGSGGDFNGDVTVINAPGNPVPVSLVSDSTPAPTVPLLVQVTDATNGTNMMPTGDADARAIVTKLATNVGLPAGENHIGILTGSQKTVGLEITRPGDTTQYSVDDVVNNSTSAPAMFNLQLGRLATQVCTGRILKIRLTTDQSTCVAQFRVWMFNTAAPTGLFNDNTAFSQKYADKATRIGYFDLPALSKETGSDCAEAFLDKQLFAFTTDATGYLYFALQTKTVFTPANAQKFYLAVTADQD